MNVKLLIFLTILVKFVNLFSIVSIYDLKTLRTAPSFTKRPIENINLDAEYNRCTLKNLTVKFPNTSITNVHGQHENSNIQWLTITESLVHFLPNGFQHFFKNIQFLDVNDVGLLELHHLDMAQFRNLKCLWMIGNELEELKLDTFDGNRNLFSIDFSRNRLKYIDSRMTSRIISLNSLQFFSARFEDNDCTDFCSDFIGPDDINLFQCHHENEIYCNFKNSSTCCTVNDGIEFLGIRKTKIIDSNEIVHENVTEVKVVSSNFTKIHKIFGVTFKNLEILEVHGKIQLLEAEDLKKFKKLRKLNLAGNDIKTLNSDVFVFNVDLEYIDLSSNKIEDVGDATFSILKNLKVLNFLNNAEINEFLNSKNQIENSRNLQEIMIDDVIQCQFSTSAFRYSGILYYCEVINPKIIDADTVILDHLYGFAGPHAENNTNKNVKALISKYSKSTSLDPKVSYHFPYLRVIRITKSSFMYLHDRNFRGLEDLQVLDMSNNQITELPRGIFENNRELIFVDFSGNRILRIYGLIGSFKNLRKFNLKSNLPNFNEEFSVIDEKVKEKLSTEQKIYGVTINCPEMRLEGGKTTVMSYKKSSIIKTSCQDKKLQQITELRPLTSVNSSVASIFFIKLVLKSQVMYFLPTNLSTFFPNLEILNAKGKIRKIFRENFEKLFLLEVLDLSMNDIEFIEDDLIFQDNPKLTQILLDQNKIIKISENVFVDLKNLEFVDLNWNECAMTLVFKIEENVRNLQYTAVGELCGAKLPDNFGLLNIE